MEKTSELVWLYVKRRPFIKEMLRKKVINYSALAREISITAFGNRKYLGAIKVALQRISYRLDQEADLEEKVLRVIKKSSITIRNKIAVVITSKKLEDVHSISSTKSRDFYTYIIDESELNKIKMTRAVWKTEETMSLITISSSEDIEETPGVISTLLNLLSGEGINIVEFISCYTDTLLVVRESDTSRAYEILSSLNH